MALTCVTGFTASVIPRSTSTSTPTGTVQFVIDGSVFGAPVTLAGGRAVSPSAARLGAGWPAEFRSSPPSARNSVVGGRVGSISSGRHVKCYSSGA